MPAKINKKYLFFDLDGTITESKAGIVNGAKFAMQECGVAIPDESKLDALIGPPLRQGLMDVFGVDATIAEKAAEIYRGYYFEKGMFENALYAGVAALLPRLRARGYFMGVATSKLEGQAVKVLEHFKLAQHFDIICGRGDNDERDTKAEVIAYALERAGAPRLEECVMIGDRLYDINGANSCGLESIGVLYGYGSRAELEGAGATWIAASVEELGEILGV